MIRLQSWKVLLVVASLLFLACNGNDNGGTSGQTDVAEDRATGDTETDNGASDTETDDGVVDVGEEPTDTGVDAPPPDDEHCIPTLTGDELALEGIGDFEFPDCLNNCPRGWLDVSGQIIDLRTFTGDGYYGIIDEPSETHTWPSQGIATGPDYDIIAVIASARTMIEVVVEPADEDSLIDPVIFASDGGLNLVYNSDASSTTRTARIVVGYPFINDLPLFLDITDARNYEQFATADAEYVGGDDYDYNVRFRTFDFAPHNLGSLQGEVTELTLNDIDLACPSDIHYYVFEAPATSDLTVSFDRTGSTDFIGFVAGMNTIEGQLGWEGYQADDTDAPTGHVTIDESFFSVCFSDCGSVTGEFIFAVSEWYGVPFPNVDFAYNLTVTLD